MVKCFVWLFHKVGILFNERDVYFTSMTSFDDIDHRLGMDGQLDSLLRQRTFFIRNNQPCIPQFSNSFFSFHEIHIILLQFFRTHLVRLVRFGRRIFNQIHIGRIQRRGVEDELLVPNDAISISVKVTTRTLSSYWYFSCGWEYKNVSEGLDGSR